MLAQHLTTRPTEDLDFFTAPGRGHVPAARGALEAAAWERGWATERIHDSGIFCRLVIRGGAAEVVTDLAVDTPPDFPASSTAAGPRLAPRELAGRKLLALFDRAAARDFADVVAIPPASHTFSASTGVPCTSAMTTHHHRGDRMDRQAALNGVPMTGFKLENGPHAYEFRVRQLMQGSRRPSPAMLRCATCQSRTAW